MGKKSKGPKLAPLPDMAALQEKELATGRQNVQDQTLANRANQVNQFGQVNWNRDPTSGAWTQTESYNPEQQALLNTQIGNQKQMGTMAGGMLGNMDLTYGKAPQAPGQTKFGELDYSSLGAMPGERDYSSLTSRPEVGKYNQEVINAMRGLQAPQLAQQRAAKEAQMAAMGLNLGSGRAYDAQQDVLNQGANDADLKAILAGYGQGNTEFGQQQGLYGQDIANMNSNFAQGMAGRQQGATELERQLAQQNMAGTQNFAQGMDLRNQYTGEQNQMLQNTGGLLAGAGPEDLNFGSYASQGLVGTPDYTGNAMTLMQAQQAQNNAKAASKSGSGLGGMIGGIAGSFAGPMGSAAGKAAGDYFFK